MPKMEFELDNGVNVDTITGRTTQRAVFIKSGMRHIYIGMNTLVEINDFCRNQGIKVTSDR